MIKEKMKRVRAFFWGVKRGGRRGVHGLGHGLQFDRRGTERDGPVLGEFVGDKVEDEASDKAEKDDAHDSEQALVVVVGPVDDRSGSGIDDLARLGRDDGGKRIRLGSGRSLRAQVRGDGTITHSITRRRVKGDGFSSLGGGGLEDDASGVRGAVDLACLGDGAVEIGVRVESDTSKNKSGVGGTDVDRVDRVAGERRVVHKHNCRLTSSILLSKIHLLHVQERHLVVLGDGKVVKVVLAGFVDVEDKEGRVTDRSRVATDVKVAAGPELGDDAEGLPDRELGVGAEHEEICKHVISSVSENRGVRVGSFVACDQKVFGLDLKGRADVEHAVRDDAVGDADRVDGKVVGRL